MYSIILPTYCEKENVKDVLDNISCYCSFNKEVIVVDDNSPDGTYEFVSQIMKGYDFPVILLKRQKKLGLGSAYRYALKKASGDYIILMDADMSHHPKYIASFVRIKDETQADIVNGTRYASGGGIVGWASHRLLMSKVANKLAIMLLGLEQITDTTGSFRLYNAGVLKMLLNEICSNGYSFQMETLQKATEKGYNIKECPFVFFDRTKGQSKLGLNEIVRFVCVLAKLTFCRFSLQYFSHQA